MYEIQQCRQNRGNFWPCETLNVYAMTYVIYMRALVTVKSTNPCRKWSSHSHNNYDTSGAQEEATRLLGIYSNTRQPARHRYVYNTCSAMRMRIRIYCLMAWY